MTASLQRLWRLATSGTSLSLADQCAVSGLSFALLLLMGAYSGLAELAAFSLAMSVVALALATLDALVTRPFTVQMHQPLGGGQGHLRASFKLTLGFAGATLLLCAGIGAALAVLDYVPEAKVAFALAVALPGILLREFGRRISFARERSAEAFFIDAPVAAATLAAVLLIGQTGELTAATALLVLGGANLAAALSWTLAHDLNRGLAIAPTEAVAAGSWLMGRWLFLCQLAMQAQGYTTHWLALVFLGPSTTGIYAACLSVVALANPMLYGLFNVMSPKSARTFHDGGLGGAVGAAGRDAVLLSGLMLGFCLLMAVFGELAVNRLFPGLGDTRHLLVVLSASVLVGTAGVPAAMALTSANRASHLAAVVAVAAVVNLVAVLVILPWGGLLGAAYAMVFGEAVGTAGRWIALSRAVASERPTSAGSDEKLAKANAAQAKTSPEPGYTARRQPVTGHERLVRPG